MRLAILGTRGIPANYGGFETFAQALAPRLVRRGHEATVYCRAQYVDPAHREFEGVRLQQAPTIRHKYCPELPAIVLASDPACPSRRGFRNVAFP